MKYEEKLEFKKEILKEVKNCISFDGKGYSLSKKELEKLIQKYEIEIEGIKQYLEHNTSK